MHGRTAELLAELVDLPSVTPDDAGCQAIIGERLEASGFACETIISAGVTNLWARRGERGPVLCFAGHTDVVPPGKPEDWASDPFTPRIADGVLYGRGAADMKGGLAAMVIAAEEFVRRSSVIRGSLAFLLTSDEEGEATDGTRAVIERLASRDERIDWCVIGEPSSHRRLGDVMRIGRRGSLSGALRLRGVPGHVAYPHQVDNPIERFAPALADLASRHWDDGDDFFPATSFQFVSVSSSSGADNVTPPDLEARFNFRYSPAWEAAQLIDEFERTLEHYGVDGDIDWRLLGEPFLTPDGTLVDVVSRVVEAATGLIPEKSTSGGTSDGRFIRPYGAEVVELGPVNATIHQVDENVRLADIETLAVIYRRVMETLLTTS